MISLELPEHLTAVLDAVRRAGGRPLIVGGSVRDAALEKVERKDFDVEVYGLEVEALLGALERVGKVNQVGKSFGVLKMIVGDTEVDFSLPRRESKAGRGHKGFIVEPDAGLTTEEASARRDFTINAMAYDPASRELLDYFGGLDDLKHRVLRHTSDAFAEDPLRVLRGMQFAGRFRLRADPDTVELSRGIFPEYDTLAIERIWGEWYKWAAKSAKPSLGLEYLRHCGWWEAYPELTALHGCRQDRQWHPEGDVWVHTLLVIDQAADIAARDGLPEDQRLVLVLAALCHDLGKPATTVVVEARVRSPGHTECVETYERFLGRIGCPHKIAERITVLCRFHMTHLGFAGSGRQVRRLARSLGEGGETIEMLARLIEADHSGRPPLRGGMPDAMRGMLAEAQAQALALAAPTPLLQGRHLLEMGLEAGPQMGRILRAAYESQLDGVFQTLDGARDWARQRIPPPSGDSLD